MTFAILYRFLHMHADKLIKENKCIHVPLHVCRSFARQPAVSLALSGRVCFECDTKQQHEKTHFQWDPTDACLNEGGEGQETRGEFLLLLHMCTCASRRLLLVLNQNTR